jgi:hypothetical protein
MFPLHHIQCKRWCPFECDLDVRNIACSAPTEVSLLAHDDLDDPFEAHHTPSCSHDSPSLICAEGSGWTVVLMSRIGLSHCDHQTNVVRNVCAFVRSRDHTHVSRFSMRDGSDLKGAWTISQPREVGLVRLYLVLLAGKGVATGPFVDQYRSSPHVYVTHTLMSMV